MPRWPATRGPPGPSPPRRYAAASRLASGKGPPRWLWNRLLGRVRASGEEQKLYPRLGLVLRTLYLGKRVLSHVSVMDFSITPGRTGYLAWRVGLVGLWQRRFTHRPPRPERTVQGKDAGPPVKLSVVLEGSE